MEITLKSPADLDSILNRVHDLWFDVDALKGPVKSGSVIIPLARSSRGLQNKENIANIEISSVGHIEIRDPENVGIYDINTIEFDPKTGCLKVTGGIPVEVRIYLTEFNLTYRSQD